MTIPRKDGTCVKMLTSLSRLVAAFISGPTSEWSGAFYSKSAPPTRLDIHVPTRLYAQDMLRGSIQRKNIGSEYSTFTESVHLKNVFQTRFVTIPKDTALVPPALNNQV